MSNSITITPIEHFSRGGGFHHGGMGLGYGGGFHHGGRYGYSSNLYPSYGSAFYDYPYESNYNYYPFNPCTCSQFESAAMCARRRNGYGCL